MTSKKEVAFWEAMAAKWQEEAREQQREKIDAVLELEIERDFYKDWAKKCELWWREAQTQNVEILEDKNCKLKEEQLAEEESDRD